MTRTVLNYFKRRKPRSNPALVTRVRTGLASIDCPGYDGQKETLRCGESENSLDMCPMRQVGDATVFIMLPFLLMLGSTFWLPLSHTLGLGYKNSPEPPKPDYLI